MKPTNARGLWRAGGLPALVATGIGLLLASGGPPLGFPVYPDDFTNLSHTWSGGHFPSMTVRPVSSLVVGLLSLAGTVPYYAALHVLTAAYVFLWACLARRLFPATAWRGTLAACVAAFCALLFERAQEYVVYTGLITNLVSGTLAVGALLAFEAERARRLAGTAAGLALFSASLFAKEDFALAVILWFGLRALERRVAGTDGARSRDLLVLAVMSSVLAAFLGWSLGSDRTSYLRLSGDTYRPDFGLVSLARTSWHYLTCTPGARFATAVQLAAAATLLVGGRRVAALRVIGMFAITLALIVPYAALPKHLADYYAFNWTVPQATALVALAPWIAAVPRTRAVLAVAGLLATTGAWLAITQPGRSQMLPWYKGEAARSRRVLGTLAESRDLIRPWPAVGVVGAAPLNPWFGNDGAYLRFRESFGNDWVVFAGPEYLDRTRRLLGTLRLGSIDTRSIAQVTEARFPVLALEPDGSGRVVWPDSGRQEPGAARVSFSARPQQVRVCDATGLGVTTLDWDSPEPVEIRVGSLDGPLFSGPAARGSATTGKWVIDGTTFFLRDAAGGIRGVVSVRVSRDGCG